MADVDNLATFDIAQILSPSLLEHFRAEATALWALSAETRTDQLATTLPPETAPGRTGTLTRKLSSYKSTIEQYAVS
jgi:hypothetical protein